MKAVEAPREGLLPRGVELLVAEEDDAVLVQRVADLAHRAVVEILGHVDAKDLGATGARERADFDWRVAHVTAPPSYSAPTYSARMPVASITDFQRACSAMMVLAKSSAP